MDKINNNKSYNEKIENVEYLPVILTQKIKSEIFNKTGDYRTKNNLLKCIALIYHKQVCEYHDLNGFVPLGRNYWKTIFGGNYHSKIISPLLELNIIESQDFGYRNYSSNKSSKIIKTSQGIIGIRYRINPELLSNEYDKIEYLSRSDWAINNDTETLPESLTPSSNYDSRNFNLSIDVNMVTNWLENNAESICMSYYHPDFVKSLPSKMIIPCHEYDDNFSSNFYYRTIEFARQFAESRNMSLFFYKDSFYIANVEYFLKQRILSLKHNYLLDVLRLINLPIIDIRSQRNLRLHNYLTNFPGKILQFLKINNQTVVQLDLRTSQFLFFANLLNIYISGNFERLISKFRHKQTLGYLRRFGDILNQFKPTLPNVAIDISLPFNKKQSSSDVIEFIADVFYSDFYFVVQKELELPDRGLAKLVLFHLIFKQKNKRDILLDGLKKKYPVVLSIIEEFKIVSNKEKESKYDADSDNNFAVFLQCIESEIFIDNILLPLREKGIPCFTRHDSIVVASGYEDEVEVFIKNVFNEFGFLNKYKFEDKFWEIVDSVEIEDSGYLEWLIGEYELRFNEFYETPENVTKNENNMEESQENICNRLLEIGEQEDYYGFVDLEFLEELSELPIPQIQKNILYDEIINLREGYGFLQKRTNELLRYLRQRLCDYGTLTEGSFSNR